MNYTNFQLQLQSKKNCGFTLVELIVVITILAILGTIAFISFMRYPSFARNAARKIDIANIESSVNYFLIEHGRVPAPTDGFDVVYSGSTVWTQGVFGPPTLLQLGSLSKVPVDPLHKSQYAYSVTSDFLEFQIAGVFESPFLSYSPIPQTYAAFITNMYVNMEGNYNGYFSRARSGNNIIILAAPSIISTNPNETDYVNIINNNDFSYNKTSAFPANYTNLNFDSQIVNFQPNNYEIFSGSIQDFFSENERLNLLVNLQSAYSGVTIDEGPYEAIQNVHADLNNPSPSALAIACGFVKNNLFLAAATCEITVFGNSANGSSSSSSTSSSSTSSSSTSSSSTSSSSTSSSSSSSSGGGSGIYDYNLLPTSEIVGSHFDSNGYLWVSTPQGLGFYDEFGNFTLYTTGDGLVSNDIFSIDSDSNGNVWIGTAGGVSMFNPNTETFTNYTYTSTNKLLVSNHIESVYVDSSNDVWFATDKGVSFYDGSTWTKYTTQTTDLSHKNTYNIIEDSWGNTWVATHLGANRYTPPSTWVIYKHPAYTAFTNNQTNVVFQASDQIIWIGTDAELIRRDVIGNTWLSYRESEGLVGPTVTAIIEDTSNNLWIGTRSGVSKFNGTTFTNYTYENGDLSDNIVNDLWQDPDTGNIHVYTNAGVSIINN